MWETVEDFTSVHVVPVGDLRCHDLSGACWCCPRLDDEDYNVVVHNALDGREAYERGDLRKH